jgi:pimeloyl-ACP methyl ester carboxylesterase
MLGWHHDFCRFVADRGFFVIRFDNRDAGLSDKFPNGLYTLADMAADTAGLLTALGIDASHVVGQSMGGMIAQQLAIDYPQRVLSLALIYTSPDTDHIIGADILAERSVIPHATNRQEAVDAYLLNEAPCAGPAYPHDEQWLRTLGGLMYDRNYDPDGVDRQRQAITGPDNRLPALARLSVPTLIIHGDSDALISPTGSEAIHHAIRGSELKIYPGMGHQLPRALWTDIINRLTENTTKAGTVATTNGSRHSTEPAPVPLSPAIGIGAGALSRPAGLTAIQGEG